MTKKSSESIPHLKTVEDKFSAAPLLKEYLCKSKIVEGTPE